jgi:glycine betaine catabolism B
MTLTMRAPAPLWNPDEDDTLICCAVRRETHDVKTFIFQAIEPRRFAYLPGQFMTFSLTLNGEEINRSYTLSSTRTRPDRVSITVKRIGEGPVSSWLHANLTPGLSIKALGPMGDFFCEAEGGSKYLFLSAGSGITPLMSMTRSHHDLASGADIAFVHSARSPSDLIFRDELALMAKGSAGLAVTSICETDSEDEIWTGHRGRIDLAKLEAIVPDFREREVYICGPAPYMAAVKTMLEANGYDMARYHYESFDFAELSGGQAEPEAASSADQGFKVEFKLSRRTIDVAPDRFILAAAKAEGMRLPSSCTKGMCGTCKCKLVSGTVDMTPAGGIRQREIDQGMILICCSKPTSDLVLER